MATPIKPDIMFENCGSIIILQPLSRKGNKWVEEKVRYERWQKWGGGVACDHRMAGDLMEYAANDGLVVK